MAGTVYFTDYTEAEVHDLPQFTYLELEPASIRIFELFPGNHQDPIVGTLRSIQLPSQHEVYQALSYAWGDNSLPETIVCDGCSLHVTTNLFRTLHRLRQSDTRIVLWIDAICINQGKDVVASQERTQQVALMSRIFSHASLVIIDLGYTEQDFGYLLKYLEYYTTIDMSDSDFVQLGDLYLPGTQIRDLSDLRLWKDFMSLLQLPWFQRLWCFQEYILAKQNLTLIGARAISHFDVHMGMIRAVGRFEKAALVSDIFNIRAEIGISQNQLKQNVGAIVRKYIVKNRHIRVGENDILEPLLTVGRYLKVTDPRDKIYAIHALLPSTTATEPGVGNLDMFRELQIDYLEPFRMLQMRFSLYLITNNRAIWVLLYSLGMDDDLPSWVLSLAADDKQSLRQVRLAFLASSTSDFVHSIGDNFFRAGGSLSYEIDVDTHQRCLRVKGCIIDIIEAASPPFLPIDESTRSDAAFTYLYFMSDLLEWAEDNGVHDDILWRVLYFNGYGEFESRQDIRKEARDAALEKSYYSIKKYVLRRTMRNKKDVAGLIFRTLGERALGHIGGRQPQQLIADGKLFLQQTWINMPNMRIVVSASRIVAAVPDATKVGDQIAVFVGIPTPFILRQKGQHYQIVGSCYVHGYMDGQALLRNDWTNGILTIC